MNILPINNIRFTPLKNNDKNSSISIPQFGLKLSKPLDRDTVSFGATAQKTILVKNCGANRTTTAKAADIAKDLQPSFENFLKKLFKPLLVTTTKPNNVIADIIGRAKSEESIREKTKANNLKSIQDIFDYLTDLNGCKIILRDGSKDSVEQVLEILLGAITIGALIPVEIDNKRPIAAKELSAKDADKYDYADNKYLNKFAKIAAKESGRELFVNPDENIKIDTKELLHSELMHYVPYNYHKTNYSALHFLLKFPGQKRVFELQITGLDVGTFKDLDDKLYKILDNKDVPAEFKELKDAVMPFNIVKEKEKMKPFQAAMDRIKELEKINTNINRKLKAFDKRQNLTPSELNKIMKLNALKTANEQEIVTNKQFCTDHADTIKLLQEKIEKGNAFNAYRAEVFLAQREKEPKAYKSKTHRAYFPTQQRGDIPDMNDLYDIYLRCNKKYKARLAEEEKKH